MSDGKLTRVRNEHSLVGKKSTGSKSKAGESSDRWGGGGATQVGKLQSRKRPKGDPKSMELRYL